MRKAWAQPHDLPWSVADIFSFQIGFGEYHQRPVATMQKALAINAVSLSCVDIPFNTDLDTGAPHFSIFSGGGEHQGYCASVAAWFEKHHGGFTVRQDRLHYAGGIADVASVEGPVYAECGYTQTGKVLSAVEANQIVIVVPYGYVYQADLCGFVFSRGPNYAREHVELFSRDELQRAEDKMWEGT